jgi:hypothetical protein
MTRVDQQIALLAEWKATVSLEVSYLLGLGKWKGFSGSGGSAVVLDQAYRTPLEVKFAV